jgi:hypothetical protein
MIFSGRNLQKMNIVCLYWASRIGFLYLQDKVVRRQVASGWKQNEGVFVFLHKSVEFQEPMISMYNWLPLLVSSDRLQLGPNLFQGANPPG